MANRDRDLLIKEYEDIHAMYKKLSAVTEYGVPMYSKEWIYAKIGNQFYKKPITIEKIVYRSIPEPREKKTKQES